MPQRSTATVAGEKANPSGSASGARVRRRMRLAALFAGLLLVVIIPFWLFEDAILKLSEELVASASSRAVAALAGFLLLAADVVLPVPATLIIPLLGGLLGSVVGTLVAAAGLTLGCVCGFFLGRRLGHDFAARTLGADDFAYLSRQLDRYGVLVLALCRPVPVLAEASVIAAGVTGMASHKVFLVTTFANIGFAAVYAGLGASAATGGGFLLALAASIALPLAAMLVARVLRHGG